MYGCTDTKPRKARSAQWFSKHVHVMLDFFSSPSAAVQHMHWFRLINPHLLMVSVNRRPQRVWGRFLPNGRPVRQAEDRGVLERRCDVKLQWLQEEWRERERKELRFHVRLLQSQVGGAYWLSLTVGHHAAAMLWGRGRLCSSWGERIGGSVCVCVSVCESKTKPQM